MTVPVALGVGAAAGVVLVLLVEAVVLWLYCRRAEHNSTRSTLPDLSGDPELTRPIPVVGRHQHPGNRP